MTGWVWLALAFVGGLLFATLGDLARAELAGWLDLVPHAVLRLAAAQLSPAQRQTIYEDEWFPELCYILMIERVIANFKTWRIMHTDYRRPIDTFATTISAVIALHFWREA